MRQNGTDRLSQRKLRVLAAIVDAYVASGEPIGSKLLAEQLGVSSATVRNEMAALAESGYLEQPHTSAGRVPSQRGYRMYVDHLMGEMTLSPEEQMHMDRMLLLDAYEPEQLLENASRLLAGMTRFAAVSTTPSGSGATIRGVQFAQTGRHTAMAILMLSNGGMKNRIFHCDFDITQDMMRIFFRVLNERLAGMALSKVTPAFIQKLAASLGELAIIMSSAIMAVLEMAQDALDAEIRLNGQMNLLFYREYDSGGVRRIVDFLESRQALCRLLFGESAPAEKTSPVRVLIGQETNRPELQNSSVIVARYDMAGQPAGVIGVLGPTRMDYRSLVARMAYLSSSVGRTLTALMQEE